ncbi:hypothetical protein QZH41_016956, partial [Actinostola sp. cb2023]
RRLEHPQKVTIQLPTPPKKRTLESAPPTPEKKPPGPTAPTLAVKHLRRKHRPKRTKNNKSGVGEASKRDTLIADLAARGDDFTLLQETYVDGSGKADKFNKQWGSQGYWSFGTNKCARVGILTRANSQYRVLQFQQDTAGRVMSLLVACGQRVFNFLCIYAPAGITARKEFIRDLHQYFYTGVPVIVGGDFNCIESTADQFGHATDACKAGGVELTALKANFDLIDIRRQQHRNVKQYTWWKKDCSVGSRLDKFLIDKRFLEVRNSTIEPCVLSDHEYVSISMKLTATLRMSHLWKLNVSNLEDPEYTRLIEQTLDKAIQRKTHSPSLQEWWDELKQNIRTTTQTYDKQKRKRDKEHQDRLTRNIIKLKRTFDPQNKQQIQQITDLETTLRELKFQKMEGAKIRSRVQWIEQGEKPTKYFYNLEKQRAKTNSMDSVRDDNDNEVTDPNTIKTVVTDFYTNLYKKDMIDMNEQNQLLTNLSRKLNRTESQQCEGDLSLEEATNAIQEAKNGKSPGKDGLPPEFYKRFWDKLGPELVTVLNEGYEKGAHGKEFRLAQYADDTTLYIKTDRSLQQVLNVVQRYENASGARLNKTKTEAMWLGQWSGRTDTPHGLKWVKKMRILGIVFGHGEVETDNWSPKLAKLEKSLNVWRTRELSLIGKALIINTIGASRFWYAA